MNITEIQTKIEEVVRILQVAKSEVESFKNEKDAFERTKYVATEREKLLNNREIQIKQQEKHNQEEKTYIEGQLRTNQLLLDKLEVEKKKLQDLAEQKRQLEAEKIQLTNEKKALQDLKEEKEKFQAEKQLFEREKAASLEQQQLLLIREKNLKAREEKIDRIEQMTQV